MKSFKYVIQDKVGIHARPANKLVQALNAYKSKVTVKFGDKQANAKSIINLMALGLQHQSEVEFVVDGEDEDKVVAELPEILKKENI
ncbi:phosphocarrier protein of PTS system [Mycoplasma haemofelis str. Langford 1]|uniref:Phosphocarrier protein HPr n=2 Tax=Mycoplasma haemofelis TaxID=29501 RepID=F6FHR9_MYCHI|nr:HPr family phosphocarrier protein [Mycoplasma haemofelis]AEG73833.1 phosphocarrier, HPr family protein [Mycoplasma haemofelis Ohio2]CBY93540.1 phosphocarrier protein of PTS system [Mycoplasma haemofelis str. Langford 1]